MNAKQRRKDIRKKKAMTRLFVGILSDIVDGLESGEESFVSVRKDIASIEDFMRSADFAQGHG